MKKLLMLGGSDIQVSAIQKAKALGHYVVSVDYLPNNPGHRFSDEYHNISTTDKESVLELAKKLNINGILSYASDPGALTAAYVGEHLNLPTNSYRAVELLSRKDLFRAFMLKHGFPVPESISTASYSEAENFVNKLGRSAVLKPVDSSGSRGIFRIEPGQVFSDKFKEALSYSNVNGAIIEEFIHKKGFQIGGDGFLVNGRLAFRCFGDIHFSKSNNLLPCAVSLPTLHPDKIVKKVHESLQNLLSAIGMNMGGVNFDVLIDKDEKVYILEIGARNGGNMIPELTEFCTGVDMTSCSINSALSEEVPGLKIGDEKKYFSHYVIHAHKSGHIKGVTKSDELKKCILHEHYNFKLGDRVEKFRTSANRLGILLLQYSSKEEMLELIEHMPHHLKLEID